MQEAHEFLKNLALVLCVAAVATVVFQRLRQPVVFGYLLAGLIVGPHVPIPFVADETTVNTLAELGVILLMFSLGLKFNLRKLAAVAPTAGLVALAQASSMMFIGYVLGQLFGWTTLESVFAGAIIAISSTTIIVKAFAEHGIKGKVTEIVFGILIIEDLIAIFLLVILTALSSAGRISPATLGVTALKLALFLVVLIGVGLQVVPRLIRIVVSLGRKETTLVASIGICFAFSLIALSFGYSVALGAFIAGSLIAESGTEKVVEHLVHPVRDMFAAIFFVSVGMLIDPARIVEYWPAVLVFSFVVIVGNLIVISVSAFFTGVDTRTAVQAGMSLGQIGEFSFIIAGLGLATGATGNFLYPVAIAVSALTTLTTPMMIRSAAPVAAFVDRKLPRALQTFAALYGSWIERRRTTPPDAASRTSNRRFVRLILLDAVLIATIVVVGMLELVPLTTLLTERVGVPARGAPALVIALLALVAAPLVFGLVKTARRLAIALAVQAMPAVAKGKVDLAAAPRLALVAVLQLGIVSLAGLPIVAITQPFLPPIRGAAVIVAVLVVVVGLLGFAFWRSAANLQGHARAGAEIIAATLSKQVARPDEDLTEASTKQLEQVLPGMGHPIPFRVPATSSMVGKTLASINLRGNTGATILAMSRDGEQIIVPTGRQVLRGGDLLALAGTHEAIERARELLRG